MLRFFNFAALFLFAPLPTAMFAAENEPGNYRVYVGTYTGENSEGIYQFQLDAKTGKLSPLGLAAKTVNPSFLALSPDKKFLYSVGEIGEFGGKNSGALSAFRIDDVTGKLTLLNQQPSIGAGPCFVTVDQTGKFVLAANYGGGSVVCFPVKNDGSLGEATGFVQHEGSSVNKARQEGPHAHSINFDPANKFVLAADLGLDKVLVYQLDRSTGKLTPHDPAFAKLAAGAGPRHFAFHPAGKFIYVINELDCTVTLFDYDAEKGTLDAVQTISTLPHDLQSGYSTAEIVVHPSGKFLYGSNRGHDSIAVFSIDEHTGKLAAVEHQSTAGKTPRNFNIDPTGKFLLAGNQASGTIQVFLISPDTGALEPVGPPVAAPTPVCLKFLEIKE